MPDLVRKRFGYGQLWPLWPACSQIGPDRVYARSDFLHSIQFHSRKEGPDHTVQNRPRSDLDGLVRFGPNGSGPETSWCARITGPSSGRMQLARYQFPTFRLGRILPQMPQTILCPTSPDPVWFRLTASGLGPNGSGPEASRCARITGPASGQRFPANPDRMRIQSDMFAGLSAGAMVAGKNALACVTV